MMPVLHQLRMPEVHPISYQFRLFLRKPATDNFPVADPHQRLCAGIDRMHMRRIVIFKEHLNDNSIEDRDSRHRAVRSIIQKAPQLPTPRRMLQLAQRLGLDLADAFAGHRELLADFLQRVVGVHADAKAHAQEDRKSTRLNSSHTVISYAVFCLKKKNKSTSPAREATAARTTLLPPLRAVHNLCRATAS